MNSEDEIEMSKNDTLEKQLASWDTDDPEEPIDEHGERVAYKKEMDMWRKIIEEARPDEKLTKIFEVADSGAWLGRLNIRTSWDVTDMLDDEPSDWGVPSEKMFHSLRSKAGGYPEYIRQASAAIIRNTRGDDGPWRDYSEIKSTAIHNTTWFALEELNFRVKKGTPWRVVVEEMHMRCVPEGSHDRAELKQMDMYRSPRWRKLRVEVLTVYGAECMMCGRNRKEHGVVVHVDHIIPVSRQPRKAFHFSNLQVLCEDCNLGKSNYYADDWRPEEIESNENSR